MKASARIAARARPGGGTCLTALAGQAPLLLRQTDPQPRAPSAAAGVGDGAAGTDTRTNGPGSAVVHLVGGAAGPIGGDELHYSVDLGPDAHVQVRSAAATIALPGPLGEASTLDITAHIADGACLSWSPQPLIVARGAHHRTTVRIELAGKARLLWREETLLGRHGEQPGSIATRLRVQRDGKVLLDHTLAAGPRYPGSLGAAVTSADNAVGTILIVDAAWEGVPPADRIALPTRDGDGAAITVMPLPGPAVLISALASDGLALRGLLDAAPDF